MGKSQKPLRIATINLPWEEFDALAAQGHEVWVIGERTGFDLREDFDLILGPRCWMMNEDLRKYLPLALAEGRRVKYPRASKETP